MPSSRHRLLCADVNLLHCKAPSGEQQLAQVVPCQLQGGDATAASACLSVDDISSKGLPQMLPGGTVLVHSSWLSIGAVVGDEQGP